MDSKRLSAVAIAVAAFTIASAGIATAQTEIEVIAETGTSVPEGWTLVNLGPPVIGDGGTMAFNTGAAGPSVGPGNDTAIVATNSVGDLEVIAREGSPASGGGFYWDFGDGRVNGNGDVAFVANVMDGTLESGIWVNQDGITTPVVGSGDTLCNAPPGVTIAPGNISFPPIFNLHVNGDHWAATAEVTGPGGIDLAVITGQFGGSPCLAAREGGVAPDTGGATYDNLLGGVTLDAHGNVTFEAFLTGPSVPPGDELAVFEITQPGDGKKVVQVGGIAPGTGGLRFKSFGLVSKSNSGEVAFAAELEAPSPSQGIFFGLSDNPERIVATGDPAPGTNGEAFAFFDSLQAFTNGAGQVIFPGTTGSFRGGLWIAESDGEVRPLVLGAGPAPGIPGATFKSGNFIPRMNGLGEVFFEATIEGLGIDASNDEVVYGVRSDGTLMLIMQESAMIDLGPSSNDPRAATNAVKTVTGIALAGGPSGGEDGRPGALSEGGQVAFRLSFTDGTQAVVVAPPKARPVTLMAERPAAGTRTTLIAPTGFAKKPVVIAGPATGADKKQGVVRLNKISKDGSFEVEFDRWTKGTHGRERASFLVMPKGRQKLDGTTWEAGTLKLKGNNKWSAKKFKKKFKGTPELFLTLQTSKDKAPATVRARNVTKKGFEAALQEAEKSLKSGHKKETVGYVAVYSKKKQGSLSGGIGGTPFGLARPKVNHKSKTVLGEPLRLEEEKSKDKETKHKKEKVSVMTLGPAFFAQQVTDKESDTTTPRRR